MEKALNQMIRAGSGDEAACAFAEGRFCGGPDGARFEYLAAAAQLGAQEGEAPPRRGRLARWRR
jgi:hypothetical protein